MFSNKRKEDRLDTEQREQFQYARTLIKQKKRLMRHFIIFLVGSVLLIIINPLLGIGKDFFINNWFAWVIFIWTLLLLVHLFNVFIMNRFMGKEWEDKQLEKLKLKQEKRIVELQKKVEEATSNPKVKKNEEINSIFPKN